MATDNTIIHPDQAHAARILLHVSEKTVGLKSGLGAETIEDFEHGQAELDDAQQEQLRTALEELGADFLPEDADHGYGVRRRYNARKVRALNKWEGEGGPAL
ncbi:hypothetical protein B841_00265 [Corynebacterium maris DSM 45190]|uniref:XRE family transcriptional regulator n=1 Tax=Corynebacterium maris DSM 45190 TaxID=1224163 RepID=S5TF53_9CORY|nr:hypothetical protein [Corynebacterium maris]AGS33536.1 hypothetical protein B841_00265 [Corynebacterium maris DSM 45190]